MRISDWSSDVCSSDLGAKAPRATFSRSAPVSGGNCPPLFFNTAPYSERRVIAMLTPSATMSRILTVPSVSRTRQEIGRAACRDRGGQYVELSVVAGSLKKKKTRTVSAHNRNTKGD